VLLHFSLILISQEFHSIPFNRAQLYNYVYVCTMGDVWIGEKEQQQQNKK
jgi:hypothetical protein